MTKAKVFRNAFLSVGLAVIFCIWIGLNDLTVLSYAAQQGFQPTPTPTPTSQVAPSDPVAAMQLYLQKRLPAGETTLTDERYVKAEAHMAQMEHQTSVMPLPPNLAGEQHALAQPAPWQFLGPNNFGGRTRALLIHPTNPNTMYAGSVAGGVWKTTDGGANWRAIGDNLANLAIGSLALDLNNPNVIYAGTGEGYNVIGARVGAGIYKSTDGGATWVKLAATASPDFIYVNKLISVGNQRVYAATTTGVFRSLDGGATWKRIFSGASGVFDLVWKADTGRDVLIASVGIWGVSGPDDGIYRNADAANADVWEKVWSEPDTGRISLAIAPSDQQVVYAAVAVPQYSANTGAGVYAVLRSAQGGALNSWTKQVNRTTADKANLVMFSWTRDALASECGVRESAFYNNGWHANTLAVDPLDAQKVWLGGVDLFRSDDAGVNWGIASYAGAERSAPQYAHAYHHALVFHPQYDGGNNRTLFIAGDGGIAKTENARANVARGNGAACSPANSTVQWKTLNNGYAATQFFHGAVSPDGSRWWGGAAGFGVLTGTESTGASGWNWLVGDDGGVTAVDPTNLNTLYTSTNYGWIRKSTDGGATWVTAMNGIRDSGVLYNAPLIMDVTDYRRLWFGARSMWGTANGAALWSFALPSDRNGVLSAIAVAPSDRFISLAGTAFGEILRTRQPSEIGPFIPPPFAKPRDGFVSWLTFDPIQANVAYATYSTFGGTHVWRTNDGGLTWSGLDGTGTGALPDIPVHCLVIDPNNRQRLYVGTDAGIFVSTNGGTSWMIEQTAFPRVATESLAISTTGTTAQLFAFTYGRGVWRAMLGAAPCQVKVSPDNSTLEAAGGTGKLNISAPNGCAWQASVNPSGDGWLTLSGATSGTGNGTVIYTATALTTSTARAATISVSGHSVAVVQNSKVDLEAPTVRITSPISVGEYRTTQPTITLRGTASDDTGVVKLELQQNSADNNAQVSIEVRENWESPLIQLSLGLSRVTVVATDAAGKSQMASINVLFNPNEVLQPLAGFSGGNAFPVNTGNALTSTITAGPIATDAAGDVILLEGRESQLRKIELQTGKITKLATVNGLDAASAIAVDRSGNVYVADGGNHRIRRIGADGSLANLAGNGTSGFSGDGGPASAAQLSAPSGIAVDSNGNIYFADKFNYRVRRISPIGVISTIAGTGTSGTNGSNGPALAAQLGRLGPLALDGAGNLYVADAEFGLIRKINLASGQISRVAGALRGQASTNLQSGALALDAFIFDLQEIAVDRQGNIYFRASSTVYRIKATTGRITRVAGGGLFGSYIGAPALACRFEHFTGLALDAADRLLIAEYGHLWRVLPIAQLPAAPLHINVTAPTLLSSYNTMSSQVDVEGEYVNPSLSPLTLEVRSDRGFLTYYPPAFQRDQKWQARVSLAPGRNQFTFTVNDVYGNTAKTNLIINYTSGLLGRTIVGQPGTGFLDFPAAFSGDGGAAYSAKLSAPNAVAIDAAGNLLIADMGNNRIRKVSPQGLITTIAGNGLLDGLGDGGQATQAALNNPTDVVADGAGNIYIADTGHHRIRKINAQGVISTLAGTGFDGSLGDGGAANRAQLNQPYSLALDASGNLYVSELGSHRIRKITQATGVITTVVGGGYGFSGDGGAASSAKLNAPQGLAIDKNGNLYIADSGNRRVRKVTPAGIISTIAGNGEQGSVYETEATKLAVNVPLIGPVEVATDEAGNIYCSDIYLLQIQPDGKIKRIAGNNVTSQFYDDGGDALTLLIYGPPGLAVDRLGNIYLADKSKNRVVLITPYREAFSVNAASYSPAAAVESIVATFGTSLATTTQIAGTVPLPTTLAGVSVRVRDSQQVERFAPLFFVSPGQINYQIPAGTAQGLATVLITDGQGRLINDKITVEPLAPALFAANANGQGVAAAVALRVNAAGAQSYEPVANYDNAQQKWMPRLLDFGAVSDRLYLILYGTGWRNSSNPPMVTARVGDEPVEVLYAGTQGGLVGLDQINLGLPRSLAGRGEVEVALTVNGQPVNPLRVSFAGTPCSFQVTPPTSTNFNASGGSLFVNVATASTCYWQAFSDAAWLSVTFGLQANGSRTFALQAAANTSSTIRTAKVRVAGQTLTFTQNGAGDLPPLNLTVTTPTASSGQTFTTSQDRINLRGTASGGAGIVAVRWQNYAANGFASGLNQWAIDALPLKQGLNEITLTALDQNGNAKNLIINVTFQPEFRLQTVMGRGSKRPEVGQSYSPLELDITPSAVLADASGNVYVGTSAHVLRLTPAGTVTVIAGNGEYYGAVENVLGTQSALGTVAALAFDNNGNLLLSDVGNGLVRRLNLTTGVISTIAGSLNATSLGDGALATRALLSYPRGVAMDAQGNLYIADSGNFRVRIVESGTGIIRTFAGNGEPQGTIQQSVLATTVPLDPSMVLLDKQGNLFVSASGRVHKINLSSKLIVTVAGGGDQHLIAELPATSALLYASGMALDAQGRLLIVSAMNVFRLDFSTNLLTRIAGKFESGFAGDGGPAVLGQLYNAGSVALGRNGNLLIADTGNQAIRQLIPY